jgi:O-antigen/teichoic acid export membrane protein
LIPFDLKGDFHPVAEGHGLRKAAVRGAGVAVFGSGVSFFVQLAGTVILARALTPTDFGIVTMVTTFSLLLSSFGLNGFTEAILQREEITNSLASNLFWINFGAGVLLTVAFALLGPLMAMFYHDPLVIRAAEGLSLTIIASSLSVIHLALLNRALRFTAVSANKVAGGGLHRATGEHLRGRLDLVPLDSGNASPRSGNFRRGQVCFTRVHALRL